MKSLIIGGSGMVGGALSRALERVCEMVVSASFSRPTNGGCRLDIRNPEAVQHLIDTVQPAVIFVAVNTRGGADACEENPRDAYDLNVVGTRNVAKAAAQCGAKLVYYSTDYLFDGNSGPYSEEDQPNPVNEYGKSKWEAEQIVSALCSDHLILRTSAVFGWVRTSPNFAMQVWTNLQAGRSMRVPCDQWCNPTLSDHLAEVSVRLVQMHAKGLYNEVGAEHVTRLDLAKALARAMALDTNLLVSVRTAELGQKARRPLRGGLKTDKRRRFLGVEPFRLTESIETFRRQWQADTK